MKLKKIIAGVLSTCMVAGSLAAPGDILYTKAAGEDAAAQNESNQPLRVWYNKPASQGTKILSGGGFGTTDEDNMWQQFTLPIGNSKMGANVYGEIGTEHLTFNQKTLWNGGPSDGRPDYDGGNITSTSNGTSMAEVYRQVGKLFLSGQDGEASDLCNQLVGEQDGYGAYQSWGDIFLQFDGLADKETPADYVRDLDLTTAISNVDFSIGNTSYHREYFISHDDNVLAMKLTSAGTDKMNFNVSFPVDNAENVANKKLGKDVTITAEEDTLITQGKLQDNQMKMSSVLKVIPLNGTVAPSTNADSLDVKDATEVVIYVSADTDYQNVYPEYRTGETPEELTASVSSTVEAAAAKAYESVKADHIGDYSEIFDRVELNLGQSVSAKTTDVLLADYKADKATKAERAQLEVLLYQFGRFLTIESSRDGDLPANLQGVWQNRVGDAGRVPWGSDYHMNVNLQMNYWPTYSANMAECAKPLVDYVDSLRIPGRKTAEAYFGIKSDESNQNGFTAHTQNTPFGWTCPGWSFSWGWSPAAVPWILQNVWEYYEYTGDKEYMREKIYPMLREEARLYDQILVDSGTPIKLENGEDSTRMVSVPAYSPEHGPRTLGNAYEQVLIWQLYEDAITAAEILGVDEELADKWKETQERLAPIEIGDSGQIKEWYSETTLGSIGERGHRHMSHLLGLFPGDLVSVDNDEYMDAAIVSLEDRGMKSTGWGMGQRINSWARTGDGEKSYQLIKTLFNDGVYPNLWDTHAPFQIDGNFGYTSGVNEMLMQSNMGYINILPAIPAAWDTGSVNGIVARGNFELGIDWAGGKASQVRILSKNGGDCAVQYTGISQAVVLDEGGNRVEYTTLGRDRIQFPTTENGRYTISGFPDIASGPTGLEAVYTGAQGVELTWDEAATQTSTYNVYRKDGGSYEKLTEGLTKSSYTDTKEIKDVNKVKYKITTTVNGVESLFSEAAGVLDITIKGMIDDTNSRVVFSNNWQTWSDPKHYGGGIHFVESAVKGDKVSLVFSGTGIRVIAPKNKNYGTMEVFIDKKSMGIIDFNAASDLKQQVAYEADGLSDTKHTIELVATGEFNPPSTKSKIEIDAFQVLGDKFAISFDSEIKDYTGTLPEAITDYEGSAVTLPEAGVTIKGFEFKGWSDGKTTYLPGAAYRIPNKGKTMTAVWEETLGVKIPSANMTAKADSEQLSGEDGKASNAIDGNLATYWHSAYSGGVSPDIPNNVNNSITLSLGALYEVSGLEYLSRLNPSINGRITSYSILYSMTDNGDDFQPIQGAAGDWENSDGIKQVKFAPVLARRIQIRAMHTAGTSKDAFISAREFYIYETGNEVTEVDVTEVSLNKTQISLEAGKTEVLAATIMPENATNKNISWTTADPEVATVEAGVISGVKEGETTITVTSAADPTIMAACQVTVTKRPAPETKPVTGISLSSASEELEAGKTLTLSASIEPLDATNQNMTWESSDLNVASVAGGVVTAVAPGVAEITVKSVENPEILAVCTITVIENVNPEIIPVTGISVQPEAVTLQVGNSQILRTVMEPANATNQNVMWSSADETIAAVIDGVVTGAAEGTVQITVTSVENPEISASVAVTVEEAAEPEVVPVEGITVTPDAVSLEEGATQALTFAIVPENATVKRVTWSSSDDLTASVSNGVVTANKTGTATITAVTEDGGFTASCVVTVTAKDIPDPDEVKVTGVSVVPEMSMEEGDTDTITAQITPENADNKEVVWESSNKEVAVIDGSTGVITAIKAGTATLTAETVDGNFKAYCTLTVRTKTVNVTEIKVNPANVNVKEGVTTTLTATVLPENATNKKVIWISDDNAIASVTVNEKNQAVVKAMKAGSTMIAAMSWDGSVTSICNITVTAAQVTPEPPKPVKYTVTLDAAKGTVSPKSIAVEAGKPYGKLPTPKRSSYQFMGWYSGKKAVKSSDICKGNITLTAKWKLVKPGKVTGLKAVSQSTSSIKLSWKKVTGASKYTISRYDSKKKKWTVIKTTSSNAYSDNKRSAGSSYKYRVSAANSAGTGVYSSTCTAVTKPVKPTISLKKSGKDLKITWKKISAYGLEIQMKNKKGTFEKVAARSGKGTLCTRKNLKKGTTYTVRVRGYMKQGKNVYGEFSKARTIKF